jgi:caffeoyl-CoA O-methyltransferase
MLDPKAKFDFKEALSDQWINYALKHSEPIPALLNELERVTNQKILQPRMLSGPLQGRLLSLLSNLIKPVSILEIGTYTGYSTICLAEGLSKKGILHTIDSNEELVCIQKEFFEKSDYNHNIQSYLGKAIDVLPKLDGPFDLVYIDADKVNYGAYFEIILPKMKKGGLIISDNVLWSGKVLKNADSRDQNTKALQIYNDKLKSDSRVKTVLLPFRDGISLSWIR